MAGLVVQHNMSALNANNKMNTNVAGLKKATEKLSSGYQINRAGDNAAGLAISEKMRSQIRGLAQATRNANDGISLIQTAEGGLNETHSILQRMRELAVQSANGTYQDDTDREAIQLEVDALKSEIDRISTATEYNGMKLLDGSLGGTSSNVGDYGPKFGVKVDGVGVVTSDVNAITVALSTTNASGKGGENAVWSDDGKTLTINLAADKTYTQSEIDDLIASADRSKAATNSPANVTLELENGILKADTATITAGATMTTVAGKRASSDDGAGASANNLGTLQSVGTASINYSDTIILTRNTYGANADVDGVTNFKIATDVDAGKETVELIDPTDPTAAAIHLATGVDYTEKDIEDILKKAGYDIEVKLYSSVDPNGEANGVTRFNVVQDAAAATVDLDMTSTEGAGVAKDAVDGSGKGLTFQIGANGVKDQRVTLNVNDMSSAAIGVANADVSTREAANKAIEMVDKAVKTVSMQRAGLGALQNRLEYTVNNLTTTNENLTNAESQIRDTDMATEMINYTKFNILQQASQAMLAQANQQPQAVLQLLG